jgi:GT2 family glycosyltransferase
MARTGTISVVIISRNEGAELQATVRNLLDTLPPRRRELVVVDDGSTDGSTRFLEHDPDVRLLRSDGVGVANARNFGASHATGDVIVFCDAHMRAPKGWHARLLEPLQSETVGAVAPGVYSLTEPRRRGFGLYLVGPELHARWSHKRGKEPARAAVLPGCFLAMRRDVFAATGGFDSGMRQLGGNDNELSLRLWLLGYELLIVPKIEVGHLFRTAIPFDATWASVVHNRLRTAFVHFGQARIGRVVDALRGYNSFPNGLAMTVDGDVFTRRNLLHTQRRRTDDWFFDTFGLEC